MLSYRGEDARVVEPDRHFRSEYLFRNHLRFHYLLAKQQGTALPNIFSCFVAPVAGRADTVMIISNYHFNFQTIHHLLGDMITVWIRLHLSMVQHRV